MSNGMFGAPAGAIAADTQNYNDQANHLNLAMGGIALQKAQIDLQSQEKMMQMLAHGFGGRGGQTAGPGSRAAADSTAGMMDTLAQYAASAGLPKEAATYAKTASTLRRNKAYIETAALNKQIKESTLYANLLDGVHDQQGWQQANALFTLQTGRQMPWARLPYNPQLVQKLKQGAISAKDKATIAAAKAREDTSKEQLKVDQARIHELNQRAKMDQQKRDLAKKTGGGKLPLEKYVGMVTDLAVRDFGAGQVPPQTLRTLARPVAERTEEILRTSPGLQPAEAAERAYQEAKAAGDFGGLIPLKPKLGSKENPFPAPTDGKFQPNAYYKLADGKTYLYDPSKAPKVWVDASQTGGL